MKAETMEWLKERATFGTGTKAQEILDYITELEDKNKTVEFNDKARRCLAMADSDRPTWFNYGSGE